MTITINGVEYSGEIDSISIAPRLILTLDSTEELTVGEAVDIVLKDEERGFRHRSVESIEGGTVVCAMNPLDTDLLQNLRALGVKA